MSVMGNYRREAVITPRDIHELVERLRRAADYGLRRNLIQADCYGTSCDDVAENIFYDIKLGVIDAWASQFFPEQFTGIPLAETGLFDMDDFCRLFEDNDVVEEVYDRDDIDLLVIKKRREYQNVRDIQTLREGKSVFRAAKNRVTSKLLFPCGKYSKETETFKWVQSLAIEGLRVEVFCVFTDLGGGAEHARTGYLQATDPAVKGEKRTFLGWLIAPVNDEPRNESFVTFCESEESIDGISDALFTNEEVDSSCYANSQI